MEKEKPLPAPPPNPPTERKRPHDISLTEPVILSPPSSTTEHENHRLIRLEFYTRTQGKDQRNTTNNEPLQTLIKNALTHVYKTVPSFEVHPLEDWPKRYTTVSSTVKTAPGSEKHSSNHNGKIAEKLPIITTPDALPTDRIGLDKYFQYTSEEHHPGEPKKIVVRLYSTTSKTVPEIRQALTTELLQKHDMWMSESRFDTLRESTIGWILKVHPDATNRGIYESQLYEFLKKLTAANAAAAEEAFTPVTQTNKRPKASEELSAVSPVKPTCPLFSVFSKRTGVNLPTTDGKRGTYIATRVLQIRCETAESTHLQHILADACKNKQYQDKFIPYSLKASNPSLYIQAIKTQQVFLSTATVICVDGFSSGGLDLPYKDESEDTLRSLIGPSQLFIRIDETVTSSRSKGRVLFLTDFARREKAEEFLDTILPNYFDELTWDQKDILLLPGIKNPTRVTTSQQSDPVSLYVTNLSKMLPPLSSVEFDSSAKAHSSSNTNAWTKKRNPIYFLDKPKTSPKTRSSPNKTTIASDTSETAESTATAPTLATQLSQTEALIDSKLAAFRSEFESSIASQLSQAIAQVVAPLAMQFEKLSNTMELILARTTPMQTPQYSTAPLLHHHRNDDDMSVHTQSPGRPLPPDHPNPHPPTHLYAHDTHHAHAPPQQTLIYNEPNPDPDIAQHHHSSSQSNHVDHPMADPNLTMGDLDQSAMNYTMTEQQITAQLDDPLDSQSPPTAREGILRNTSDQAPSGGASK